MKLTVLVFITLCVTAVFCQDSRMEKMQQLLESSNFAAARARLVSQSVQSKDHLTVLENQHVEPMPSGDEAGEELNLSKSSRKIRAQQTGCICCAYGWFKCSKCCS